MGEAALARRAREGDGDEDDGQGDAVVEAALDVEALADPDRDERVAHHRLAERGVGGREDRPQENRLPGLEARHDHPRREGPRRNGQGQADSQQPGGQALMQAEVREVDSRGIGEEHQHQGELGETVEQTGAGIEPPELSQRDPEPE